MPPPRDGQRAALYAWERSLREWPGAALSLGGCQELVRTVWGDHLRSEAPLVTDGRGRRRACYTLPSHQIRLPRWSRTTLVVLHETAHGILCKTEARIAHHGPEFARLYLNLLYRYGGVELSRARSLAVHQRPRRVYFARLDDVLALLPDEERRPAPVLSPSGEPLLF